MSEKGIIKLVTSIVLIIGITIVCVAFIVNGEMEVAIVTIFLVGLFYIVLQLIKRWF